MDPSEIFRYEIPLCSTEKKNCGEAHLLLRGIHRFPDTHRVNVYPVAARCVSCIKRGVVSPVAIAGRHHEHDLRRPWIHAEHSSIVCQRFFGGFT